MENVKISYLKDEQGSIISPVVSIKSVFDEDNQPLVIDSGLPIGSGMDYFGTTAPVNYMFADGSAISRTEYSELFSIIGTTYGSGDGSTTFNLPDKRSRVSVMVNPSDTNFTSLGKNVGNVSNPYTPAGTNAGTKLTTSMIPYLELRIPHVAYCNDNYSGTGWTHTKTGSWHEAAVGADNVPYHKITTGSTNNSHSHTFTGTAANISTLQPTLVCNYIIKVKNSKISALSLVLSDLEGEY